MIVAVHPQYRPEGTLMRPHFHGASLKVAQEELLKALAVLERTKSPHAS
jgi:hypothetical protein